MLPVLTHTSPAATADALHWRYDTMPSAQRRAAQLGLSGAAFPWRTINGEECSGYWPAGTAGFHINANVADAVVRYVQATGNLDFERRIGLALLVQTARLWSSLAITISTAPSALTVSLGPDEYSALADNNVYTNLLARRNLTAAAAASEHHRFQARQLQVTDDEIASWRIAAMGDGRALRRAARCPPASRRLHPPPALRLRQVRARPLPAAAARPLLRALRKLSSPVRQDPSSWSV